MVEGSTALALSAAYSAGKIEAGKNYVCLRSYKLEDLENRSVPSEPIEFDFVINVAEPGYPPEPPKGVKVGF